jgi:predicted aconitase with swiveling domain
VDTFFALASIVADELYHLPIPLVVLAQEDFARLHTGQWVEIWDDAAVVALFPA